MEALLGHPGAVRGRVSSSPHGLWAHACHYCQHLVSRLTLQVWAVVGESKVLWLIKFSESQQFEQCFFVLFWSGYDTHTMKERKGIWYCRRWCVVSLIVLFLSFLYFCHEASFLWINNTGTLSHRRHMCCPQYFWIICVYFCLLNSLINNSGYICSQQK